jgi:hypothetical protein
MLENITKKKTVKKVVEEYFKILENELKKIMFGKKICLGIIIIYFSKIIIILVYIWYM